MTIKHLVLSGGGDGGYILYGALKYLSQNEYFDISNIKTIYCVSIGALIGVFMILKYDWSELDDYIIKRPWNKVISIKLANILNMWKNKGILDIEIIVKIILNTLLSAKGLSEEITLKEFYEYNNIDIHIFTSKISMNISTLVDLSYKTHPELKLYKALAMSAAFPIIFSPIIDNSECFIDGGFINNYPIDKCILNVEKLHDNIDEILSFKLCDNNCLDNNINININDIETNEYIYILINRLFGLISSNKSNKIDNLKEVECKIDKYCNFLNWKNVLDDENIRKDMIEIGVKCGEVFLQNLN